VNVLGSVELELFSGRWVLGNFIYMDTSYIIKFIESQC